MSERSAKQRNVLLSSSSPLARKHAASAKPEPYDPALHEPAVPNIFDDPEMDDDVKWKQDKDVLHALSTSLANAEIEIVEAERNLAAAHKRVGDSIASRDKLKQELAAHRAKLGK